MNVTLQHLTKRFPNRNKKQGGEVVAVDDFTYEIPDGKLVGLLGPSGCGKRHDALHDLWPSGPHGRKDFLRGQGRDPSAHGESRGRSGVPELCSVPPYDGFCRTSSSLWKT